MLTPAQEAPLAHSERSSQSITARSWPQHSAASAGRTKLGLAASTTEAAGFPSFLVDARIVHGARAQRRFRRLLARPPRDRSLSGAARQLSRQRRQRRGQWEARRADARLSSLRRHRPERCAAARAAPSPAALTRPQAWRTAHLLCNLARLLARLLAM